MGLFEDLSAKLDEAKQASVDEHTEVMAAIDALSGGVTNDPSLNLTADQKTQLLAKIDDLKTSIQAVHDATVTPPPPPGPDVTPTPSPNPSPSPGVNPDGTPVTPPSVGPTSP